MGTILLHKAGLESACSFAQWQNRSYSGLSFIPIGVGAGVLAAAGFGFVSVLVHQASARFPVTEIMFVRALIGAGITLPLICFQLGSLFQPRAASIWVRAGAAAGSILCLTWNLAHTSIAISNILFNAFLLLVVIAGAIAGEVRISSRLLVTFLIIFSGIVVYWFGAPSTLTVAVVIIGLSGALAAAISYTALKKATKIASPWLINWAVCAGMLLVSGVQVTQSWSVPNGLDAFLLASIGIVALLSQYLTILSFARLPLTVASALSPSAIVWSVVVDIYAGGHSSLQELAGATIYTAGICLLVGLSMLRGNEVGP